MENNKKPQKKLIQSIKRASEILKLFVDEKNSIGITEFSQALSLPKTTIQGIVNTLNELDYLEKDPTTNKYRLGPMLFQLGMVYATNMDLVEIARGWMERLCFQFRQPVNVGMVVGDKVVIVLRIEPENRFMVFPQVGSIIPWHTSAIGKVLFAHLRKTKKENILKKYKFEKLTVNSITDKNRFLEEIEQVKKSDISHDNEENLIGLAGIGAPILNHENQVIAAFALTGNAEYIKENMAELQDSVKYTSLMVSRQLGSQRK